MARKSRSTSKADYFASADSKDVYYGSIYSGMIKSTAFQNLSNVERLLYVYCRCQHSSEKGRQTLYRYAESEGKENLYSWQGGYFVFPSSQLAEYGLERATASRAFQRLEQAGFIEVIEKNAHRHKMNVYRFCNKWRD